MDLRKNSDYFPIQNWLTGFYNGDGERLMRDTSFIYMKLILDFKHDYVTKVCSHQTEAALQVIAMLTHTQQYH